MKVIKRLLICILIAIYTLINFYIVNTISREVMTLMGFNVDYILLIIFGIGTIATILTYGFTTKSVGAFIGKLGVYFLGISIIGFFLILITNLIGRILSLVNINYKYFAIVQLIIILLIFIYGRYNICRTTIKNYNIKIDKKSKINKLNIVLISDLHLGYFNDNKKLKRNVDLINYLKPDLVVIAGDLFDQNFESLQKSEETKKIFDSIQSTYGIYLALGNHDAGSTYNSMKRFIEETKINLLEDMSTVFDEKFVIVGRKDLTPIGASGGKRAKSWDAGINHNLPIIVLDHQPIYKEYNQTVDLILSGHTHKGQIFPFNLITKKYFENHYGYLKLKSGIQTIVTSGLGTWGPPMRIGSKNEIVKIDIEFEK